MRHYIAQEPKSVKKRQNVSRLVIMKALDRSGLVKVKVNVKTPQGVIQAYRWVRPGEALQQEQQGAQAQPQGQQSMAPVIDINLIRKRSATKVGSFINHGGQELKVTAVGQHGVTARDGKGNKYQVAWDKVFKGRTEPEPGKVAEPQKPYRGLGLVVNKDAEKSAIGMTKEEFVANPPEGFVYDPNAREEANVHRTKGKITLGPKFFNLDEGGRKGVIAHEKAHELESSFTPGQWSRVMNLAQKDMGSDYGIKGLHGLSKREYMGGFGKVDKETGVVEGGSIGERLTDIYAAMLSGDDDWAEKNYPEARKLIMELARENGKESPPEKPADREKKFKESTKEQRMSDATWDDVSRTMDADLSETRFNEPPHARMRGDSVGDNVSRIKKNAMAELKSMANYLAGDTALRVGGLIQSVTDVLEKYKDEFKGVKAEDMDVFVKDFVQKLLYQEIESNRRQFTDHGIRHIVSNIDTQQRILDAFEKEGEKISGRDRLLGIFAMINHDVGYTHPLVRDGSIDAAREHKEFGEKIAEEQRSLWDEGKVFNSKEYDRAVHYIGTHDAVEIGDWKTDPLATATRLSDNLSLFAPEKLPEVFKHVSGGKLLLLNMGRAAADKDTEKFEQQRKQLSDRIDAQENIGMNLKRDLKAGVADINYMTPKFAMGSLAGEISDINPGGEESLVSVKVKHNDFDTFLQQHFDMGQKALRNFLKDQGINPPYDKKSYNIGDYKGKPLVKLDIE